MFDTKAKPSTPEQYQPYGFIHARCLPTTVSHFQLKHLYSIAIMYQPYPSFIPDGALNGVSVSNFQPSFVLYNSLATFMSQQLCNEVEWQGKANKSTTPRTAQERAALGGIRTHDTLQSR